MEEYNRRGVWFAAGHTGTYNGACPLTSYFCERATNAIADIIVEARTLTLTSASAQDHYRTRPGIIRARSELSSESRFRKSP